MKLKNRGRLLISAMLLAGSAILTTKAEICDTICRSGKLSNGLTYFIYPNATQIGRADFFLSRNIGSRVEKADEKGLAHFLEHMCFNGSRNFPDNKLIEWLESKGVKFGKNLNAHTSADETVYNISMVPTLKESVIDSCLLVLRDWSDGLTLSDTAIDVERGVIEGEWRHRDNASSRMLRRAAPRLYPNSPYGEAMPIGDIEVVRNFSPQRLRDFYRRWYTPSTQAIIVTGDIDPDMIEKKIESVFADLKADPYSQEAPLPPFPGNKTLSVIVESDPEQSVNMLQLYFKHGKQTSVDKNDELRSELLADLTTTMLAGRFDDLELEDDTSVANVGLGDMNFLLSRKTKAFVTRAQVKPGRTRDALEALYKEILRGRELGFSEDEFNNAMTETLEKERSAAKEKAYRSNTEIANYISRYFIDGGTFETPQQRLARIKNILPTITTDDCREWLVETVNPSGENAVVLAYLRKSKEHSLPTEDELAQSFMKVNNAKLVAYTPRDLPTQILKEEPMRGKIVKREPLGHFGAELLTLSNGVKVMLKPTDFKKNQIFIRGVGEGGFSQNYTDEAAPSLKVFNEAMSLSGAGEHSSGDLKRLSAGRNLKVSVMADRNDETVEASTSPSDLEDAMRLLWLRATATCPDREAFEAWRASRYDQLNTDVTTPVNTMGELIHKSVYSNHPLGHKLTADMLQNADYDRIMAEYKDRFSDFSDFTFYITGNFDSTTMDDLLERYVASLPTAGRIEKKRDIGYRFTPRNQKLDFKEDMVNPLGIVYQFRHMACPYTLENILLASITSQILKTRLLADLREKKGWTYSITTHGSLTAGMNGEDGSEFMMPVYVKTAPDHISETADVIKNTLSDMAKGVTSEEFEKVRKYMDKNFEENQSDNTYWLAAMRAFTRFGLDLDNEYMCILSSLTPTQISNFISTYVIPAQTTEMTMGPK